MLRQKISRTFCRRSKDLKTALLKRQALMPAFERLEERLALSVLPLIDINSWPMSVPPSQLTKVDSIAFFTLETVTTGIELWKSDGTETGTELVKDIRIGEWGSYPSNLTNVSGTLFFTANYTELWKSDGTEAGTVLVKDIGWGLGTLYPGNLTNVDGTLFFSSGYSSNYPQELYGQELWKSDGTAAGTVLVKDIRSGFDGSYPNSLTDVDGTLFFLADDGSGGEQLWKSDGTDAGTQRVSWAAHYPRYLTNVDGVLFFNAVDFGYEGLWKSNGTEAGTQMVKDFALSGPKYLTNVNGVLFFSASHYNYYVAYGEELWKSDGTEASTVLVKNINLGSYGSDGSYPKILTNVGGTLYFSANDGSTGYELWKSDGTELGTELVSDIHYGIYSSYPGELTNVDGTLFFSADDGSSGRELWRSDGTTGSTMMVKDISPGTPGNSWLSYMMNLDGMLFFQVDQGGDGPELWKSDGTAAGTMLVKPIYPITLGSYPSSLTNVGGTLFFSATDGTTGHELWKSDGTPVGTTLVKDTHSGYGSSDPSYLTNVGCTLFFSATDGTNGQELWKSDGTDAGTVLVRDINTSGGLFIGSYPSSLTNMGCTLFFQANDGSSGKELWKSDGTAASTVLVRDIYTGPSSSNPSYLTTVGGTLFFTASDASTGVELWKSDGTAAGTTLVKDIRTGTSGSNPGYLTNVGGTLFFIADDGYFGRELWKSDGTAAGTVLVRDINFGGPGSYPGELTNVGGTLYFIANDGSTGKELWKSDGTAAGTVLVKDISQGTSGSSPSNLTNVLGMVFLSAWDSINGAELWKSDGTEAGTVLVKDIRTGSLSSGPSLLTNVAGTLFFRAYDPSTGYELWRSDGTAVGTVIAADIAEFGGGSRPSELTEVGGALFFSAENDFVGVELYAVASTVSPSNADFGDAPDGAIGTGAGNYNTLATDGGPSHVVVAGLFLGNTVDVDNGMLQNEAANADDVFGELQNDEDGVLSPATDLIGTIGTTPTVTLLVTNTTGFVATLAGWIDFDNDGQFEDATERATLLIGTTTDERATLIFPSIPSGFTGTTYARFRLTTDTALFSTGAASDGEVEDYTFTITAPSGSTVDIMDKVASGIGGGPVLPDFGRFGSSLATLGDLDGDGLAELVVGASGDDTGGVGRGAVHTLGLNASGTVTSSAKIASGIGGGPVLADWDYFGSSVASLGDLNGDGISDLAVGATGDDTGGSNRGAVHVLIMNCFGTAKSSTKIGSGIGGGPVLANENYFGASLASLGDLDGDGVFDLVVGAIGDDTGGTDRGAAHVLLLNADGSVKSSKKIAHLTNGGPALADSDLFGSSLSSPGDLDGDGVSDLFVGATGDDTGGTDRGALHVLLMNADGSVKSSTKIAHLTSGGPELSDHDHFGSSVAPLSDLDGDGVVDLIVGATGDATGGTDRGAAHVLLLNANRSVKNSTKIAHLTGGGPELSDENRFGSSVVPAGDLDGDGVFELAIGARGDNTGGAERGSVHFLSPHTFYDFLLAGFGIAEGNTTYTTDVVILTRSDSSVAETVDVVLTGVTAIAGSDFADGPISVSFAIGETIRLVPIEILGDSVLELDEMLSLSLANFTGTGRVGSTNPTSTLTIYDDDIPNPSSHVVARYVYYANSTFAQAGVSSALDTSKVLAQEGTQAQLLTYSNLINSGSGVDGLVFDIAGLPASTLTASDFVFQVSPQSAFDELANPPVSWNPALVPSAINVFPGTPSRVVIRWPQNSIVNRWLRVTIKANAHTGLAVPETYYVGHLLGETTGHSGSTFTVSFSDITPIRSAVGSSANASSTVDIDKNGTVAFADIVAMRPNVGAQLTIITIPAFGGGGSLAPMSGGLDNGGSNKSRSGNRSDQNQLAAPLVNSGRNSQLPSTPVLPDRLAQLSSLSSPIQMLGGQQVMNARRSVSATFLKDSLFGEIESSSTTRTETNAHTETEGLTTDFDRNELGQQKTELIALDAFFAKY